MTPLEKAQKLGTLGKLDRSAQYSGPEECSPERLLKAVNVIGTHVRGAQSDLGRMQRQLMNLKLRNGIVVALITAIVSRAPEILSWLMRIL